MMMGALPSSPEGVKGGGVHAKTPINKILMRKKPVEFERVRSMQSDQNGPVILHEEFNRLCEVPPSDLDQIR
jgi:hypothetical protein